MKHPAEGLRSFSARAWRVVARARRRHSVTARGRRDGTEDGDEALGRLTKSLLPSLAVFRFFSFTMGVGLAFLKGGEESALGLGLLLGVVALFNVGRVIWPPSPGDHRSPVASAFLAGDIFLSMALVIYTGGLDSPFLIYSLVPILTASLLMNMGNAAFAAGVSVLSVSGGHVAGGLGVGGFAWILDGNLLAVALLYSAVCLLCAQLPFLVNLNWQRQLRSVAVSSERDRLRREIHDNVAQALAFLSLKVKRAEEHASSTRISVTPRDMRDIASVVERCYLTVRDYLDEVEQRDSDELLGVSIGKVVGQWTRDTGLSAEIKVEEEHQLPPNVKYQLLQIAREALANVAKHAYPDHVWIELQGTPEQTTLRIRDDGRGFSTSGPTGHGMGIMRERAAMVGASLTVNSQPGEGTEVVVVYSNGA